MSIRIEHSVAGNCIILHGAERPSYPNTTVSAIPDSIVADTLNIVNTISNKYELFQIPFTDFVDVNGGSFTDVSSCVDYINVAANDMSRADTWEHFIYNSITGRIQADKPFETTLNSLYLGDQHKMSSGSENIYFTNLTKEVNWYPAWGGIKDQSLTANQNMSGVYNPTGRVFGAYGTLALGGNPVAGTSIAYDGDNYFPANISGMGITTVVAETVASNVILRYELSVDGTPVYQQFLEHSGLAIDQPLTWSFDHPLDINAGSTNHASITKVAADGTDIGLLLVCEGDDGTNRYQTTVANRGYEDKNIAFTEDLDNLDVVGFYDIYVDPTFAGTGAGTNLAPYTTILEAVNASSAEDKIFVKGVNNVTSEIVLPHSLSFYGIDGSEIRYATYDAANGNILKFTGSANTQSFTFKNIAFSNAGEYALKIVQAAYIDISDCTFTHNGWNGTGLNTVLDSSATGIAGYDSSASTLQAFYAGANASNGGAMRIENITNIRVIGNVALENLRGLRIQDCGIGGSGFITRNVATKNIESGIYIAAGSLLGSQNITTTMNVTSYNANNGLLCIGGINNKFSQNEVNGNWNAGFCAWGSANATLRDCGLYDNNRSAYNGIGNTGDAKASIQINEFYNLLGTQITLNPAARFIAEILDTQVHYTGLGSNTEKIGFLISSGVGALANNDKNIIKVDDVGFIGQDYAIDFSEVDLTNLRVALGDNSYMTIGESAVKAPLLGNYSELPFSNHVMEVPEVDVVVDTLKQTISLREGVGGNVINVYGINELQSVLKTNSVDIIQRASDRIQLRDLTLGNVYINGVVAGANLSTLNDSLNGAFSMDLVEYKQFLESDVGVVGSGTESTATFYYIESPDTEFHYPLFKTEAEAQAFDTENGGSGTNTTHTYADDLTNTTWYKPTTLGVTSAAAAPVHGVYGTSVSVVWNIQATDVDSNYVPTFTSITYNVQEGSAVNIQYKAAGMTDTFNLTGVPAGYADNGFAIVATAEDITNGYGQSIQHVINVTKANAFGSVQGTITINVLADLAGNEFTIVDQGGAIKFTQDGGATVLDFNTVTFNAGSTYKFYVDGATMQTNDVFDIVDANGSAVTGNDGLSMLGGSGPGYAGTYFQYVIPSDVEPGKFLTFTDGATSTAYPNVPLTLAGSTYVATVTGITLEGPSANQTGTNLFDAAGQHGWLSIDEPLGAGQRLVLSGAFLADLADAMGDQNMVIIGLKDGAWANTIGNAVPTGFEGGMMLTIYRISATNFQMYGYNIATSTMTTKVIGTHLYNSSQFLNYNAFLEVTSDGNNIRVGHALTNSHNANTVTYEDWTSTAKVESGDQGFGITELDVMVKGLPLSVNAGTTDTSDIDWTALSEVSVPVPPTANSTSWTKAVDFGGSNEHLKQVSNLSFANALRLDHKALTITAPTWATGTSADYHAKPWATSVVFNIDNNTSHQVIWNQGGGANNGNCNIYLKVLNKRLYFGWGKEGTGYNECMIHPTPSAPSGFLGHNSWYGVYIAHNGTRLSAADATAANLAAAFDIRLMNSAGNNWTLGSNLSVAAAWTSTGYRMDELIDDVFSIGGMETNRTFQGEIASMVITTLKKDVNMPANAEIEKMVKDPTGWVTDYKVGNNYRYNVSNSSNFQTGVLQPSLATQVWLMGDGTNDSFGNGIRNQVYPTDQNYTKMQLNNMQSNDIQNVTISGLT